MLVINFSSFTNKFHINYVATFPVEPKTKVPFAGQILFNEVFKRVLDSCTDMVELKALRYSPFSPISKYLKLGMKPMGGTDYYEKMRLERNEILSAVNKQEQFFTVTEINDRRDIPLDKCCNKHGLFHRLFLRFSNIM